MSINEQQYRQEIESMWVLLGTTQRALRATQLQLEEALADRRKGGRGFELIGWAHPNGTLKLKEGFSLPPAFTPLYQRNTPA